MIETGVLRTPGMVNKNNSKTLRRLGKGKNTLDVRGGAPSNVCWIRGGAAYRLCLREGIPFLGAFVGKEAGIAGTSFNGVIVETCNESKVLELRQRCEDHANEFKLILKQRYPSLPQGVEDEIVARACRAGTDAVGRPETGIPLVEAVERATTSHARHQYTDYEELLAGGCSREEARERTKRRLVSVLKEWEGSRV